MAGACPGAAEATEALKEVSEHVAGGQNGYEGDCETGAIPISAVTRQVLKPAPRQYRRR
jgi:hypothetical protein